MKLEQNSSFYLINKPRAWTSQDLCTKFKRIYKFDKVGHSGTLDPNATGLMLLATNKYTKLFDYIDNKDKTYVVKCLFGYKSETLDIDSEYTKIHEIKLQKRNDEFVKVLNSKIGESIQTPPKYSAIKVKGKRLYKYARKGEKVEIPKRKVNIKEIEILHIENEVAELKVKVSEGTYIRTLVNDIAELLGTNAIVSELKRVSIGNLKTEHKHYIEDIEKLTNNELPQPILETEIINLPILEINKSELNNIKNGDLINKDK
jgi:tRNA pseudouridine55 synthase